MTQDSRSNSPQGPAHPRGQEAYAGPLGRTRLETVHWTLPSGEVAAVRVHTVVNATSDPGVAERLLSGDLNWVQPAGSDELQQVTVPVIYHDEARPLFALVLPEAFRGRELEERAALLGRLASDGGQPVPHYVVSFALVYGEAGLQALLDRPPRAGGGGLDAELADREEQIVAREAKLSEWAARLDAQEQRLALDLKQRQLLDDDVNAALQAELRRREQDIARREGELRQVERLVLDRQTELDRVENRIRHEPLPQADGDSPTRVAHRESMELAAREAHDSGEDGGEDSEFLLDQMEGRAPREASAHAADEATAQDREASGGAGEAEFEDPWAEEAEVRTAESAPAVGPPPRRRSRETVTTPLAEAVLAAAVAEAGLAEAELAAAPADTSEVEVAGERAPGAEDGGGSAALPEGPSEESEEAEADEAADEREALSEAAPSPDPEVPALPEALFDWYDEEKRRPHWYLSEAGVHLAVCLPAEQAEAFVGVEPAGLLQLHRFETFGWITLAVASAGGEELPFAIHWPLDVRNDRDLSLLDRLGDDFRFALEIYDELLEPVTTQELHYSLEENVRVVRERAQAWLAELAPQALDPVLAWEAFEADGYDRLEAGALEFEPNAFQQVQSAAEMAEAVALVARWSTPDQEDALLCRWSFPAAGWRALRLRVLRQAVEFGIWMDADLRRLALDAGYATSKRDLLRASLAGFERVALGELDSGLEPSREHENWAALRAEAERLGVPLEPRWEELAEQALTRATGAEVEAELAASESHLYTDQLERLDEADLLEATDLEEGAGEAAAAGALEGEEAAEIVDASELVMEDEGDGESGRTGSGDGAAATHSTEVLEDLSPPELVVMLGDPEIRLPAGLELCRRKEGRALPELFALLGELERTEVVRLAPHLVGFGEAAVPFFTDALRSPSSLLRATSALALGALRAGVALDALIDLLLDEPTESWRTVATALGDFGREAMMSLASRIRHSSAEQKTRLGTALAEVSLRGGARDLLVDLSSSRDEEAAEVANQALEQAVDLHLDREELEPVPPPDQPVALFTRRFLDTLSRDERELAEEDIIEADDIVEEGDVLVEEPLRD